MITREIQREFWNEFCQRLNATYHGSLVSIRRVDPNGQEAMLAKRSTFQEVNLDTESDGCSDHLIIRTGDRYEPTAVHDILEPIHIRLKDDNHERFNRIQVLAETGTIILDLQPGLSPAFLDGLKTS